MNKVISIGNQGFDKLRTEDYYYIDKSDFISEWWENIKHGYAALFLLQPL